MNKFFLSIILNGIFFLKVSSQTCNNWLYTPSNPSYVNAGQINVTGNQITVEAIFNRTAPYSGGILYAGDLVSKHNTPADANYLLRPNEAEITTSNGYFRTPDICEIELNKTYHAAMVYDGTTLKFYRDGFLMSQIAATGNLFQNNWQTRIGWYEPQLFNTNFIGYTNEVRIWNVARTQAQIKANMTTSLPSPATQPGLLAYYTFDNLLNKQGNAAFNASLGGSATINQTNPNCILTLDSCNTVVSNKSSVIINDYTPVTGFNPCGNKITVEDATAFNAGDTVLMIQMKGAVIDSSNTNSFGTITNYKNAGNYEMNIVKGKAGNVVELKNNFLKRYDVPAGRVQLIRVPYFQNYTVTDTLTCLPWDGRKGGVLVLNVAGTTTMNGDINVSGKGFRGGSGKNSFSLTLSCNENGFSYPGNSIIAADKGESIYEIGFNNGYGKAPNANGGGGGDGHNAGGGGGSNGGTGGFGGYQLEACGNAPFDNRGLGGKILAYSNVANKIFMGGGGGSGHADNTGNIDMNGGNGGGIALIITNTLVNNGHKIISNGAGGQQCDSLLNTCHDGSGGGGGAGTVLVNTTNYSSSTQIEVKGGKGADLANYNEFKGAGKIGPGGGGGGGAVWLSQNSLPGNVTINNTGGANGLIPPINNPWGATPGSLGQSLFNLQIPIATIPFKKNIDSVKINSIATSCKTFDFKGLAFTNSSGIQNWQWYFGDNSTASTQNVTHSFTAAGTYTIKLIATDVNGCRDSISTTVTTTASATDFSYQQNSCNPLSIQFFNAGATPVNPVWLFGDGGTSSGIADPVHAYATTGNYTVKYSVQNGTCTDTVVKVISINVIPEDIVLTKDTTICFGAVKKLLTAPALSFCWSPVTSLDDPLSPTPTTNTTVPITYYFTAEIPGANIITNGNFSAGNTGFTSGYNFAAVNTTEGEYFVGNTPQSWNGGLSTCSDHTGGNGNMLLVNGSPVADINVWKQTVTVTPNTNYAFATWIQALYPPNPAQLSFSINGKDVGSQITASLPTCTWDRFFTTWNSGNNTTATISIVNKNTFVQGNDFALDDISFSPVIIKRDSVKISIDKPLVKAGNDTLICEKTSAQLNATGAIAYSWLPVSGLNNAAISNPIATVADTTQYIVKGTSAFGCTASDTMIVFTKPLPAVKSIADTVICKNSSLQLSATGATIYTWLPNATLNNAAIANPLATPLVTTNYIVTGTGSNGCTAKDTVVVAVKALPVVKTIADTTICLGNSLTASTSGAATYSWLPPAAGVSNTGIGNPTITPADTTQYIVKGTNAAGCTAFDTLNIFTRQLPIVKAGNDTLICEKSSAQLNATGAVAYSWLPVSGLNNAAISNPIATVADTTQYIVKGTSAFGCGASDTIIVFTKPLPAVKSIADTAICKNNNLQLSATGAASYSWLPNATLNNAAIANPLATPLVTTNYILTGTGSNGCTAKDTVVVTVNALPVVKTIADTTICLGNSLTASTSGAATYNWLPPAAGVSNTGIGNPTITPADTTQYIVKGTNATGCVGFDTLNIFTRQLPVVKAGNDTIICASTTVQLLGSGTQQYSWSPGSSLTNASVSNPIATPADTTEYIVTGTDAFGCSNKDSVTVFTRPLPVISLNADTTICKNIPVALTAGGGVSYQWSPAAGLNNPAIANPTAITASTTFYKVIVTAANNCYAADSVKITVKADPVFTLSPNDSTCANTAVQLTAAGGNQYSWSPAAAVSNASSPSPLTTTNNTTLYTVIIKENTCNFTDTLTTTVTVFALPNVQASKSNDVDCARINAQLSATGAGNYTWSPVASLNNPLAVNPIATPEITTLYQLTGTDDISGCYNTDTITVFVNKSGNANLFIPSAFSPNGDTHNECFKVTYQGRFTEFSLAIYNRWGEQVFFTRNPDDCWNGTFKGKAQNPGNYIYMIKAKNFCREEFKKGNLVLVR